MPDTTNTAPAATAVKPPRAKPGPRVDPVLTTAGKPAFAMPVKVSKRGSASPYPFDTLTEVGTCFGVKNKTAKGLVSVLTNANRKALVPVLDEAGNKVYETTELKGADGTVTKVPDTSKPKMTASKHFFAEDVTPARAKELKGTEWEGSSALVWRDK